MSSCLLVRSSVCLHISETTLTNFNSFLCMLPVTVAGSSSDGVMICCVLPVLWMTLSFYNELFGASCVYS